MQSTLTKFKKKKIFYFSALISQSPILTNYELIAMASKEHKFKLNGCERTVFDVRPILLSAFDVDIQILFYHTANPLLNYETGDGRNTHFAPIS